MKLPLGVQGIAAVDVGIVQTRQRSDLEQVDWLRGG